MERLESKSKRRRTEVKEEDDLTFSYDLVRPLYRQVYDVNPRGVLAVHGYDLTWNVLEKGSEKLDLTKRYKISYDIIKSAESLVRKHVTKATHDQLQIHHLDNRGFEILLRVQLHSVTSSVTSSVTNSVNARGAVYSLLKLSAKQKRKGVITIPKNSFAPSLCHFGKKFEIPVTVVIPSGTYEETLNVLENSEATELVRQDHIRNMVEAHKEALRIAKERGLVYIDGIDHPNVIIGQATLGIEEMEKSVNVDQVLLPTTKNYCGLTAGLAMAIKGYDPNIKVIEVQYKSDFSIDPVRKESMSKDELDIKVSEYGWHTTSNTRPIVQNLFDKIVQVENTNVKEAFENIRQKPTGVTDFNQAIGTAAMLSKQIDLSHGKRVLIFPYGKMDLPIELTDNPCLDEPRAGPSNA